MLAHRDDCIAALLPELPGASKWLASAQADFFGATLFPDFSLVDALASTVGSKWERYLELRSENLRGDLTEQRSEIVRQVKAQLVGYLRSGSFNSRRLADIVNYIRLNAADFEEWHKSETAKLFAPPVFRNERKASGYFF